MVFQHIRSSVCPPFSLCSLCQYARCLSIAAFPTYGKRAEIQPYPRPLIVTLFRWPQRPPSRSAVSLPRGGKHPKGAQNAPLKSAPAPAAKSRRSQHQQRTGQHTGKIDQHIVLPVRGREQRPDATHHPPRKRARAAAAVPSAERPHRVHCARSGSAVSPRHINRRAPRIPKNAPACAQQTASFPPPQPARRHPAAKKPGTRVQRKNESVRRSYRRKPYRPWRRTRRSSPSIPVLPPTAGHRTAVYACSSAISAHTRLENATGSSIGIPSMSSAWSYSSAAYSFSLS